MLTATFIVQLLKVAPPNTPSVAVAMEFWPLGAAETTLLFIFVATTLRRRPVSSAQTQFLYTVAQTRRFTGIWTGFAEIIRVPRDKISDMWCWSSIEFTEWVEEVAIVRNTIARSSLQATVTRRGIKVLQGCVYRLHPFRTAAPLHVQSTLRRRLVCCPCLCFLILNV